MIIQKSDGKRIEIWTPNVEEVLKGGKPMEDLHYTAFISYRHRSPDDRIAKWLHTAIETYHIPAAIRKQTGLRKMGKCFRDAEELPLAPSLDAEIVRALDASDWLIAVCSPSYLESLWCRREVEYFVEHKGRDRVLIVLAGGTPPDCFPEILRVRYNERGELEDYQPLAAEARGETMKERFRKLKTEKFRLLAPMLGVGFDDLRRRARRRPPGSGASARPCPHPPRRL